MFQTSVLAILRAALRWVNTPLAAKPFVKCRSSHCTRSRRSLPSLPSPGKSSTCAFRYNLHRSLFESRESVSPHRNVCIARSYFSLPFQIKGDFHYLRHSSFTFPLPLPPTQPPPLHQHANACTPSSSPQPDPFHQDSISMLTIYPVARIMRDSHTVSCTAKLVGTYDSIYQRPSKFICICRWPFAIGFGTTGFILTKVAMTVTDEDIKASSALQYFRCTC